MKDRKNIGVVYGSKDKNRFDRQIITAGNSYAVSIPPVVIKDMGSWLKTGVTIERKGDILIIKGRGNNGKK